MDLSVVARHRSNSRAGPCSTFLDSMLRASHFVSSALLATCRTPVQKISCCYGWGWVSCAQLFAPSPHLTTLDCTYSLLPALPQRRSDRNGNSVLPLVDLSLEAFLHITPHLAPS